MRMSQNAIDDWNSKILVGTPCEYVKDDGSRIKTKTKSHAWNLPSGVSVIMVEGISGCVDISRVNVCQVCNGAGVIDSGCVNPNETAIMVGCYNCTHEAPTINPAWVDSLERENKEMRVHRDEWMWVVGMTCAILRGDPGWETCVEIANFGSGEVPCEVISLAKRLREALDQEKRNVQRLESDVSHGEFVVKSLEQTASSLESTHENLRNDLKCLGNRVPKEYKSDVDDILESYWGTSQ